MIGNHHFSATLGYLPEVTYIHLLQSQGIIQHHHGYLPVSVFLIKLPEGFGGNLITLRQALAHDAIEHVAAERLAVGMIEGRIPHKLLGQLHLKQEHEDKKRHHAQEKLITTFHHHLLSLILSYLQSYPHSSYRCGNLSAFAPLPRIRHNAHGQRGS